MTLGMDLDFLETSQLIRGLPEAERTYIFKHNLVQQTAYESMLVQDRKDLHRRVGETLERAAAHPNPDQAELLATHFEQADVPEKVLRYATLAGQEAMRRFATREAAAYFGQAIGAAHKAGVGEGELTSLYERRGRALDLSGEHAGALKAYQALEQVGQEHGSPAMEAAGIIGAASLYAVPTELFDSAKALELSERALALAQQAGSPASEARALWIRMLAQTRLDPREAIQTGESALALARSHGLRELEAFILNDIAGNYFVTGQPSKALRAGDEARPLWRELDNLPMLADSLCSVALLKAYVGAYDEAYAYAAEGLAICEKTGNLWGKSFARVSVALSHFGRGELGPAIREMSECVALAEQAGFLYPQVTGRAVLALAYGLAGAFEQAQAATTKVLELEIKHPPPSGAAGPATRAWLSAQKGDLAEADQHMREAGLEDSKPTISLMEDPLPLIFAHVDVLLARQAYPQAETIARKILDEVAAMGARMLAPRLQMAIGQALVGQGRLPEGREALEASFAESASQGVQGGLWEIESRLGALAEREGRTADAARLFASAAGHVALIADGLAELGLSDAFRALPTVRQVLDRSQAQASQR